MFVAEVVIMGSRVPSRSCKLILLRYTNSWLPPSLALVVPGNLGLYASPSQQEEEEDGEFHESNQERASEREARE